MWRKKSTEQNFQEYVLDLKINVSDANNLIIPWLEISVKQLYAYTPGLHMECKWNTILAVFKSVNKRTHIHPGWQISDGWFKTRNFTHSFRPRARCKGNINFNRSDRHAITFCDDIGNFSSVYVCMIVIGRHVFIQIA